MTFTLAPTLQSKSSNPKTRLFRCIIKFTLSLLNLRSKRSIIIRCWPIEPNWILCSWNLNTPKNFGPAPRYLESPRIILDDFIHDARLPPEHMDSEALARGLLCVLPSRIIDLMPEDTHQIFREQISFWRFALAQWQLPYAECLEIPNLQTRDKLSKIIGLDRLSTENRVTFSSVPPRYHHLPLESPPTISEQDVRPLVSALSPELI